MEDLTPPDHHGPPAYGGVSSVTERMLQVEILSRGAMPRPR